MSFRGVEDIGRLRASVDEGANPRDVKFELARELVERFHDAAAAEAAQRDFVARFQKHAMPDEMPEVRVPADAAGIGVAHLLKAASLVSSTSEAFRMIGQGAVRVDGERIEDRTLTFTPGAELVMQVGRRRFARVSIEPLEGTGT